MKPKKAKAPKFCEEAYRTYNKLGKQLEDVVYRAKVLEDIRKAFYSMKPDEFYKEVSHNLTLLEQYEYETKNKEKIR